MTGESFGPIKYATAYLPISAELLRPPPKGHYERIPKPPEWLTDRKAFVEKWKELQQYGINQGFLEHESCYECGGEIVPTTDTEDLGNWVPE